MRQYFRKCETEVYYEAMAKSSINLVRGIRFADCRIISIRNQIYGRSEPNSKQNFKNSNRISSKRSERVSIDDKEPFSVLLLGLDTGGLGRTEQGRSDTMMVVTVNPKQKNQRSSVWTEIFIRIS